MRTILISGLLAGAFLVSSSQLSAVGKDDILGDWLTQEKKSKVTIYKCGKGEQLYCGKITWLEEPLYPPGDKEAGKPKRDRENPDKSKQNRKIIGLNLVWGFSWDEDDKQWLDGKIYNPLDGKLYSCYLELVEPGKLKVRGYVGFSWAGRTVYWTR